MGLGKTLEMIALIVTNFVDGRPLAVPIEGLLRQRKSSVLQNLIHKAKVRTKEDLCIYYPLFKSCLSVPSSFSDYLKKYNSFNLTCSQISSWGKLI